MLALILPPLDWMRSHTLLIDQDLMISIVACVAILCFQSLLAALRQQQVLAIVGYRVGFLYSLQLWMSGLFLSQVLVSFIAGDVARSVKLMRDGMERRAAARAIVLDRMIGFLSLLTLVVIVAPLTHALAASAPTLQLGLGLLGLASVAGVACAVGLGLLNREERLRGLGLVQSGALAVLIDLVSVMRLALHNPQKAFAAFGLCTIMHALNIVAMVGLAMSIGVATRPADMAILCVPITLLMILPISFAGWGVREAAMIAGFGLVGVAADHSFAISVGFGISMILASLPGLPALFWSGQRPARQLQPLTRVQQI